MCARSRREYEGASSPLSFWVSLYSIHQLSLPARVVPPPARSQPVPGVRDERLDTCRASRAQQINAQHLGAARRDVTERDGSIRSPDVLVLFSTFRISYHLSFAWDKYYPTMI
jgi:hypothetical protein